jgi:hypothetical protein
VRWLLLLSVIAAIGVAGCSKSSPGSSTAPTPTTPTVPSTKVPPPKASTTALDRSLCAAYDAFWHTSDSGSEPSPTMLARERALINAAEATPDQPLHDAVRAVIAGELGLPKFLLAGTTLEYRQKLNQLTGGARTALDSVVRNDQAVRTRCRAVGRPVNP